jgi:predicted metal-binding protein
MRRYTVPKKSVRRIPAVVDPEVLAQDLERYCHEARELGASAAIIIPANWISIDERVRLKCVIPTCPYVGRCAVCPPNATLDLGLMRGAVSKYSQAVLLRLDISDPIEVIDTTIILKNSSWKHYGKMAGIVAKIETLAFSDAHYLALGLPAGCCKAFLCQNEKTCRRLDSGICRHPLKARPSMEACGIDVFGIAARVGWEIYPIYSTVDPKQVPKASLIGIVFID